MPTSFVVTNIISILLWKMTCNNASCSIRIMEKVAALADRASLASPTPKATTVYFLLIGDDYNDDIKKISHPNFAS